MEVASAGNDSRIVAHNILNRLFRGQQQSDSLCRQIKSLEYKVELLTLQMMTPKGSPQKSTQGIETNGMDICHMPPSFPSKATSMPHQVSPYPASAIRRHADVRFEVKQNGVDTKFTSNAPSIGGRIERMPSTMVTTTTQIISLEAVPTPIPTPQNSQFQTSSFENLNSECGSWSSKSNSMESVKLPKIIEVQRQKSGEGPLKDGHVQFKPANQIEKNANCMKQSLQLLQHQPSPEQLLRDQYDKRLGETMAQLRADCQQRIQENQSAQESLYSKRESGLQKELRTLVSSIEGQGSALSSLHWKLSNLERNITAIAREKTLLESCAQDVKLGWEADKRLFHDEKIKLEEILGKMRAERQDLVTDFQHLLHAKIALDSELLNYKVLIEEEEKR